MQLKGVHTNVEIHTDRFGNTIDIGDIVIFATSGEMDEAPVTKLGPRQLSIKNSSGYIKKKDYKHVINKSTLLKTNPELVL